LVRLLLDEHLSPMLAEVLRRAGHDVVAVAERPDLRGRPDIEILGVAAVEGRVVVTMDIADFAIVGARRLPSRQPHHGVIFVSPRVFPLARDGFGRLVRALELVLTRHPEDGDLVGEVSWLERPGPEAG
jgi:hypothetical protein